MINFSDNSLSTNFLTNDDIRRICPAAFKTAPTNPGVSDKYVQANTITVINDLAKLGWYPVEAKQCRAKKNSSGIRSFHMIALQNPEVKIAKQNSDGTETVDCYPRIILTNSHDGFNSFKFMVGCFRLVCSNGLIISTDELANMSIRHINYTFESLREVVRTVIKQVPVIVDKMNMMKKTKVDDKVKGLIATEMIKIRKNMDEKQEIHLDDTEIRDILNPLRDDDKADNLWTIFNICQEKMIKGYFSLKGKNNRFRQQRRITSIKRDIELNKRLWNVATKFIPEYVTV